MDVPPPIPPRPPGFELRAPANPPLPARPGPSRPEQSYQQQGYGVPPPPPRPQAAWGPLLQPNGKATPLMEALMAAFFARLDPQGTGTIRPEALSAFLDAHQFPTDHNVWKKNLTSNVMFQPEDVADYELKAVCESWGFDHRVAERSPGRPQLPFGGMPLITLKGLTDMMAVEHCFNPDQALDGINAALRYYRIWTERGPPPRNCLLPGPDAPPEIQQRQARASERSHRMAAERLEATRVRYAIEAQGRRNALELVSDYHYVRRDFY